MGKRADDAIERAYVRRMQAGEREAQDLFIECLQPFVYALARKYSSAYSWASPRLEYEELVSQLNYMLVVLLVEKNASAKANPSGYVRVSLSGHVQQYCLRYANLIAIPHQRDWSQAVNSFVVESLDAPYPTGSEGTLADHLEDQSSPTRTSLTTEEDFQTLYEAIDAHLTSIQRWSVNTAYGLNQTPVGSVGHGEGLVSRSNLLGAYAKLRKVLACIQSELEGSSVGFNSLPDYVGCSS